MTAREIEWRGTQGIKGRSQRGLRDLQDAVTALLGAKKQTSDDHNFPTQTILKCYEQGIQEEGRNSREGWRNEKRKPDTKQRGWDVKIHRYWRYGAGVRGKYNHSAQLRSR